MNEINYKPYITNNTSVKTSSRNETTGSIGFKSANNTNSKEYVSSEASSASRAYGLSFVNQNKTIPQMSLKDMIKWLETQGKVEGKDFEVDSSCTLGNTVVTLKNQQGMEEVIVHYDNGNHATWSGYEVVEYKNGQKNKIISRDYNGKVNSASQIYSDNDPTVQYLKKDLSYKTTPEEYIKSLEKNNIKYSVEKSGEEENNRSIHIKIFDDAGNVKDGVWFYYGEQQFNEPALFIAKSNYNEKGQEHRRVMYSPDYIEVVSYINYLEK